MIKLAFHQAQSLYLCRINPQDEIRSILQKLRQEKPATRQEEILFLVNVHGFTREEAEELLTLIETEKPNLE